jgi:hypothetical protein
VPLERRDRPRLPRLAEGLSRTARAQATPGATPSQQGEHVPCRSRDAPAPACHGRRVACGGRRKHVQRLVHCDRSGRARPRATRATRSPLPATARGGTEPTSTSLRMSPCRSSDATAPTCRQAEGLRRAAQMWAASGATRSQRGEHVLVPLAQRVSPRLLRPAASPHRAAPVCATSSASLLQRAGHAPVLLARRDCPRLPRQAWGPRQAGNSVCRIACVALTKRRVRPVPLALHDCPRLPLQADGLHRPDTSPCRVGCVAITARRARPHAARARRLPPRPRLPRLAEGLRRTAKVLAASGASRSQQGEHTCHGRRVARAGRHKHSMQRLVRRDRSGRAHPRAARATQSHPSATAGELPSPTSTSMCSVIASGVAIAERRELPRAARSESLVATAAAHHSRLRACIGRPKCGPHPARRFAVSGARPVPLARRGSHRLLRQVESLRRAP